MKAKHILLAAGAACALFLTACSGASTGTRLIKTCIFPGDYPDPSIMRDGSDFYMTHSSFTYYPGLLIWHSTDLVNWEPVARAVEGQNYSIFAPELCKVDSLYYIYYPTSDGLNYVVTATDIRGPWSQPILLDAHGIDPGHVIGSDGTRYLYTNNGYMCRLSADGLHAVTENRKVYDGWQFPQDWVTEGFWLESPKLLRHDGWYYLVSAEGGTAGPETSHMVVVARSKEATGPWENSPYNPMIHTYQATEEWWSKGHGTLIDDVDGNWYIVYHAYRNGLHTLGRSTIIESVEWTADGWPIAAQQDGALWDNAGMQPDYSYLRDYDNPIMWAKWEPGVDTVPSFEQAQGGTLMTTTAIDASYRITAEFEVSAGGRAGLYLFYNENAFFGMNSGADDIAGTTSSKIGFMIENRHNVASLSVMNVQADGTCVYAPVDSLQMVDVSSFHHNNYKGFFALRPAYLTTPGNCRLIKFEYTPLD